MKFKNYSILWVMSLLIVSMNQIDASEKMPKDDQTQMQAHVIESEEFPPYSTDQYVYAISSVDKPAESDVVVEPVVVSDVIANNYLNSGKIRTLITQTTNNGKIITTTETWKTKHPSYFTWSNGALMVGAVGVVALTYLALQQQRQQQDAALEERFKKEERYYGVLTSDQLKSRQDRLGRIMKEVGFKGIELGMHGDIVTNLIEPFSDEQFDQLLEDMKKSKNLSMGDFSKMYENINKPIKLEYDQSFNRNLLKFGCKYQFWGEKYCSAAHEAGHSLVATQNSALISPEYATLISSPGSKAHVSFNRTDTWIPYTIDEKNLDHIKHEIEVDLAGGIAMAIAEGKKLTFEEFLVYEKYGMGSPERKGSDIHDAFKQANNYFDLLEGRDRWIPEGSEEQRNENILNLLKESYEKTSTFLNSHKNQLAQTTNQLYDQGIISADTIHEIAGTTKPKYFHEKNLAERVVIANTNRLQKMVRDVANFNEENPYEIHDVLG